MKVLYFSPWYPHRYDAMSGLFVRKHAEAVARSCGVCVLYLYADEKVKEYEVVEQVTNGVREVYVYYPFIDKPILRQLTKAVRFVIAFLKGYSFVEKSFGRPDVTQANVLTRCGALALWLKVRYGIPYVIVEHWTRYLPQNFNFKGFLRKLVSRMVVRRASCVLPVSRMLGDAMRGCGLENANYKVVNNVVDDFFFDTHADVSAHDGVFNFLHISCFIERAKNICGILRVVKRLSEKRNDFRLTVIGVGPDFEKVRRYAGELELLDGRVEFVGEQPPSEVNRFFSVSDAFVLFSNYENAPVVISESLATGTPVISTDVGGIPDMIDATNGCLVKSGDEEALYEAMSWMIDHRPEFDSDLISRSARCYSYGEVGDFLLSVYREALAK